jgi:NAD(P)H-hydrate epimerase
VIAIDLPTGLFAEDNSNNDAEAIIRADRVLTIGAAKLALLLPENGPFARSWEVIDIGYAKRTIAETGIRLWLTELEDVLRDLPERTRFTHKGKHGHAFLIAGGAGKPGAALLAARGCLRSGVGKLTLSAGTSEDRLVPLTLPECMVMENGWEGLLSDRSLYDAVGIGPGIGTNDVAERMLKRVLQTVRTPMVLDADALNLLAENKTWLAFLPNGSILTPHPGEFDRLAGASDSGYERLMKAIAFAQRFHVVLVLKGANTAVCSPNGQVHFNPTGNPGMAKGGSGDVLTGILTALLAQRLQPFQAARLGVFLHGLAGDLTAMELGQDGMLPSDLVEHLPQAWRTLRGC